MPDPIEVEVEAPEVIEVEVEAPEVIEVEISPGGAGLPGPAGASAYEVAVAEGFVGDEAAWLASLKGADGDPGPAGTGLTSYADMAAVDAVETTEIGVVTVADLGVALDDANLNTIAGLLLIDSQVMSPSWGSFETQYATLNNPNFTQAKVRTYYRMRWGSSTTPPYGFGAWTDWTEIPPEPMKTYASAAELDTIVSPEVGTMYQSNWGTYTGIAEFTGMSGYAVITTSIAGSAPLQVAQLGKSADGTVYEFKRFRVSGVWGAWSLYTPAGGGTGLKVYADFAEFEAETESVDGYVPSAALTGLGMSFIVAPLFTRTIVGTQFGTARMTQTAEAGSTSSTVPLKFFRTKAGAGAWSAWGQRQSVPYPTDYSHIAIKGYVDDTITALGATPFADMAALDAYEGDGTYGLLLSSTFDFGGLVGLPAYNGLLVGKPIVRTFRSSDDPAYTLVQELTFTDLAGEVVTIRRKRTRTLPAEWSAWSAWAVVS